MFKLADGTQVRYNKEHLVVHEDVLEVLKEALLMVAPPSGKVHREAVNLGRIVGSSTCVKTTDNDSIIMKRRIGRKNLTRFVLNREPIPCDTVTVILKKQTNAYFLLTAYIGYPGEKEVHDPKLQDHERTKSVEFWSTHALVYDKEIIDE